MRIELNKDEYADLIREVVVQVMAQVGWPPGRVALTEEEAAAACGVGRHVLRDLRLDGQIGFSRVAKKIVYRRDHLIAYLASRAVPPARQSQGA